MNDCYGNLYKNFFLFFTNFWVNFRWIIESNTGLPCFFVTSLFIGLENPRSCNGHKQSDSKLEPIATWQLAFPALIVVCFTLSYHWLLVISLCSDWSLHQTFAHDGLQGKGQSICWCCVVRSNIQFPTASATLKPFTKIPVQVSSYKLCECSKHELKNNPEFGERSTGRSAYRLTFLYCIIAAISLRVHSGGRQ